MGVYVALDTIKCVRPDDKIRELLAGRRDGAAPNCYVTSWGETPGFGWVIITQSDMDTLNTADLIHTLTFHDDSGEVIIQALTITHVESLYRMPFSKATDLCLLKLEDVRCFNDFTTVDKHYNIVRRAWLSDTSKRFQTAGDEITDGKDIVLDLWDELPSMFISPPTEDIASGYVETEHPENLDYHQAKGWSSVCDAAHRVGLETTIDKSGEGVLFTPHNLDTTNYVTQIESKVDYRINANRSTFPQVQRYPEKYRVLFRKAFTDVVGNTDTRLFGNEEDHQFNEYYVSDVTTNDLLTVTVIPGTIKVLYHPRVIVDRDFTEATYDTIAEEYVQNLLDQLQNTERKSVTLFSGFHDFPFQVFNMIEFCERGDGPYTSVRIDPTPYSFGRETETEAPGGKITFGYGMVVTASTKYNRSTKAVSTNGRLIPVQRDGDDTLDDSATKELEFISFSDYPIKADQIVMWVMDTNSMRAVAMPIGLQTNAPLFVEFEIDTTLTGALNATITQQFWGPTLAGSDLEIEVTSSNDDLGSPQYDLTQEGYIGLAFLQEDGKYRCFDLQCGT